MTVFGRESFTYRKGLGQNGENDGLIATEESKTGKQQRMGVKSDPAEGHTRHSYPIAYKTQKHEYGSGYEEQPAWATHQEKAKRAPSIAKRLKMGCMGLATIRIKRDRNL